MFVNEVDSNSNEVRDRLVFDEDGLLASAAWLVELGSTATVVSLKVEAVELWSWVEL